MSRFLNGFVFPVVSAIGFSLSAAYAQNTDTPAAAVADDASYWTSVYSGQTILDIDIYLTQEKWKTMQPTMDDRRGGPNRGRGRGMDQGPGQRFDNPQSPPPFQFQQDAPPVQQPGQGVPADRPRMQPGPMPGESEYEYVAAKIVINGEEIENAGLRFKGNSSYRSSRGSMKRPLKIDTDRFVDDQSFHGRTKINLSISFKDPAYIREKLGYGIYRAAGVPSPGVGWGSVTLHFEDTMEAHELGPYVVIEQVDKEYMERTFGAHAGDGVLFKPETPQWQYLGEDPQAYEIYDIKFGAKNTDMVLRFAELVKLITQAPDDVFRTQIGSMVDLDMLAGYLAATSLLVNLDSYVGMIHNYYLFIDPQDGRARLLPWDVNEAFGSFNLGAPTNVLTNWSIDQPWVRARPLLTRLFQMPEFKTRYRDKVADLMAGAFTENRLKALIDKYTKVIVPIIEQTQGAREVDAMQVSISGDLENQESPVERDMRFGRGPGGAPTLLPFIKNRITSVKAQLAGTLTGEIIAERRRGPPKERGRGRGRGGPDDRGRGQPPQRGGPPGGAPPPPPPSPGSGGVE